jgi:hypothetical protein
MDDAGSMPARLSPAGPRMACVPFIAPAAIHSALAASIGANMPSN